MINGREAHRMGLSSGCFGSASELWSAVDALAAEMALKSPLALVGTKRMLLYSRSTFPRLAHELGIKVRKSDNHHM